MGSSLDLNLWFCVAAELTRLRRAQEAAGAHGAAGRFSGRMQDGARVRSFHAGIPTTNFKWADGDSQRLGLTGGISAT